MSEHPPFCIVAFNGSQVTEFRTGRGDLMRLSAVLRFDSNPCLCHGCREYVAELERRGQAPLSGGVEARP